jgi:hypothetical protein
MYVTNFVEGLRNATKIFESKPDTPTYIPTQVLPSRGKPRYFY